MSELKVSVLDALTGEEYERDLTNEELNAEAPIDPACS